jgi:hypothetical protein
MFTLIVHIAYAIGALIILIAILLAAAWFTGIWMPGGSEDAADLNLPEFEPAELRESNEYGPVDFVTADMTLRITKPHLFANDWYRASRREFSQWAAEQYRLQDRHRREMGDAT